MLKRFKLILVISLFAIINAKGQTLPTSAGVGTAYTLTMPTSLTLVQGITVTFKANVVSGPAPTININSTGAILIKKEGGATSLATNDIVAGQVVNLVYDGTFWQMTSASGSTPAGGTVTSVALSLPTEITVTGSPITTSGTFTGTWASQSSNKVFAAPNGSAGTPTFRLLSATDIPSLDASIITSGSFTAARIPNAAGDVSGSYSALSVDKIKGVAISATAPTNGKVLAYNGVSFQWEPQNVSTGTVTNFSAGDLSPLFTTTEATTTTTPALSFTLTSAGAYSILGNNTAVAAAPTYFTPVLSSALFQNQGTTTTVLHGNAAGNPTWGQIVNADITNSTIDLTTKVTGILPLANGGSNANLTAINGGAVYSTATAIGITAAGTAGQVLTSNGAAAPTWASASASAWGLTGNATTVDGTNFIGTTDNIPLTIKVNNQKAGRIDHILNNTFFGYNAGLVTTGGENSAFGLYTLYTNTSGHSNTAIGNYSLYNNTIGYGNIALGREALNKNTTGNSNTAVGYNSQYNNTIGSGNVATGMGALYSNVAGSNATAIGYNAMLYSNNSVTAFTTYNVALGFEALRGSTTPASNTGISNTAIGNQALWNNSSGAQNTAVGDVSLFSNTTGNYNTASGTSLYSNTTGSSNTANGFGSLYNNTTGNQNTSTGYNAIRLNISGNNNVANGTQSLYNNTVGWSNAAIGYRAGFANTTASGSTFVGDSAGYANTTGNYNTFIGFNANANAGTYTNATAIGYNASVNQSNALILGNGANVGIGTSTPTSKLSVGTSSEFQVNSTGNIIKINNITTSFPNAQGVANSVLTNNGSGTLSWSSVGGTLSGGTTNYIPKWSSATSLSSTSLLYDDGTNVGIGFATPSTLLHVRKTAVAATAEDIAMFDITDGSGSYLKIANAVTTDGSFEPKVVGYAIGTNGPSVKIEGDNNNDANGEPIIVLNAKSNNGTSTSKALLGVNNNGNQKFIIDQSGKVGIGTSAPTSTFSVGASSQFQINSTGNIVKLNNVTTSFPVANSVGVLSNDGAGGLTWSANTTIAPVQSASNGLTVAANNVTLGGALTAATTITQASNTLSFTATAGAATMFKVQNGSLQNNAVMLVNSNSTAGLINDSSYVAIFHRNGVNTNSNHFAYGVYSAVTNTNATSGTNIAGYFSASGATTGNYALIIPNGGGNVGIGTSAPTSVLDVAAFSVNTSTPALRARNTQGGSSPGSPVGTSALFAHSSSDGAEQKYGADISSHGGTGTGGVTAISGQAAGNTSSSTRGIDISASGGTTTSFGVRATQTSTTAATAYGMYSSVTGATAGTNIAGYFGASSGAINYAIVVPANAGNVGIGTITPSTTLDVRATNVVTSSSIQGNLNVMSTNTQGIDLGGAISLGGNTTGTTVQSVFGSIEGRKTNATSANTAGYLAFKTNSGAASLTEQMRLTELGNLCLGATVSSSATAKLFINAATDAVIIKDGALNEALILDKNMIRSGYTGTDLTIAGANNLLFQTNPGSWTTRMTILNNGNVGIATTTPNSTLQVSGSMSVPVRTMTGATTLTATDYFIIIGAAGVATFPVASTCPGRIYVIKSPACCASTTSPNYTTLTGGTSNVLAINTTYRFISDGTNWQQW